MIQAHINNAVEKQEIKNQAHINNAVEKQEIKNVQHFFPHKNARITGLTPKF